MSNKANVEQYSEGANNADHLVRHSWFQQVTGINADATVGELINLIQTPMSKFAIALVRTAGATDTVDVDLEGSLDGVNWFSLANVTSVAGGASITFVVDKPVRFARYNVTTVGSGNTLTVQILASGR